MSINGRNVLVLVVKSVDTSAKDVVPLDTVQLGGEVRTVKKESNSIKYINLKETQYPRLHYRMIESMKYIS